LARITQLFDAIVSQAHDGFAVPIIDADDGPVAEVVVIFDDRFQHLEIFVEQFRNIFDCTDRGHGGAMRENG